MKKMISLFCIPFVLLFAGTPTMDGTFDGEGVWGSPVHTADGTAGWAGANAKKLYVTYDATYAYFGAEVTASDWQAWAFIINTTSGGGSTDSWNRAIDHNHTNKPDFGARGHFNGYAEIRTWNGSSWTSPGGLAATEFGENITGNDQNGWVEIRVLLTTLGSPSIGDVQFYITGDNDQHGSFDACPNDNNATQWDHSSSRISLSVYQESVALPVELTSFTAITKSRGVELAWKTATEVNNHGFEIERRASGGLHLEGGAHLAWEKIRFIEGHGTTNAPQSYTFVDGNATGTLLYRLKQIDRDGSFEYSNQVEVTVASPVEFALMQNHPNPFNPSTSIRYQVATPGHVSLKVYDMLGKEVATLVNGMQEAGAKIAKLDASQLPSGIYFYTLRTSNFTATKKMSLVK
jgi:hypothetical protein